MLVKSARTVSREFYLEIRVYIGFISYGLLRVLRKYLVVQKLSSWGLTSGYSVVDD